MKFSQALRGARATKRLAVPGVEATSGAPFEVLLRALTAQEEADVLTSARAFAKAAGVEEPRPGVSLYDLGVMVHTIRLGCVDPDSPEDARTASFDGGAEQILRELGPEVIAYLYEHQETWQSEVSPSRHKLSDDDMFRITKAIAEEDSYATFLGLAPATRAIWARSTAAMSLHSRALN